MYSNVSRENGPLPRENGPSPLRNRCEALEARMLQLLGALKLDEAPETAPDKETEGVALVAEVKDGGRSERGPWRPCCTSTPARWPRQEASQGANGQRGTASRRGLASLRPLLCHPWASATSKLRSRSWRTSCSRPMRIRAFTGCFRLGARRPWIRARPPVLRESSVNFSPPFSQDARGRSGVVRMSSAAHQVGRSEYFAPREQPCRRRRRRQCPPNRLPTGGLSGRYWCRL